MIRFKKAAAFLLAASLFSTAMAPSVLASSRQKVGKISLTINTDMRVGNSGGTVTVTPTGDNTDLYYVDVEEIINEEEDGWRSSSAPEVEITLGVEDGDNYYFANTTSGNFKLTLDSSIKSRFDKVEYVKSKRQDDNCTLILTIRLIFDKDKYSSSAVAPSDLAWSEGTPGTATWGDVASAKYFQVQLLKDGESVSDELSVYSTSYDFSQYITTAGSYTFKVRSVKSGNNVKSNWTTSKRWTVKEGDITENGLQMASSDQGTETSGISEGWQLAADNVRWWWQNSDGTWPASQWKDINGQWYYFDAEGYMATGWIEVDGSSYYLDLSSGIMYANARTPDGYWVDANGVWIPGM
jgi:glucan-binding YG repeat protein